MEAVILDAEKRLSESILWEMQARYFREHGARAWEQVPFYPTSNTFVAESYAELILAFLLDAQPHLDTKQPIYVVELGAGTGCFTYRCLRLLKRKLAHFPGLSAARLRYVMTDFAEKNVASWETQEQLAPYFEDRTLDLALFDPEADQHLELRRSRQRLCPGDFGNPLVVIANYFFDSVRQDLFEVSGGELFEGKVTLRREASLETPPPSQLFEGVGYDVRYAPATADYYPQETYNRILDEYRALYREASVLFPLGALRILDQLSSLSGENLVVLSSDKGFTDPRMQSGRFEHVLAICERWLKPAQIRGRARAPPESITTGSCLRKA